MPEETKHPISKKASEIADKLYDFMAYDLEGNNWVVDPSEFLPANVTVDFSGERRFKTSMAKIIDKEL